MTRGAPEPEGVAIGKVSGRIYAFIGLERTGGIMVYDIAYLLDWPSLFTTSTRVPQTSHPKDSSSKGEDSPNGKPLLVVSHEVSNTTTIFEIDKN